MKDRLSDDVIEKRVKESGVEDPDNLIAVLRARREFILENYLI